MKAANHHQHPSPANSNPDSLPTTKFPPHNRILRIFASTMTTRIPPEKIAEIKLATDTVAVIADFMPLKKRGSNYFGLSPFTVQSSPTFAVSPNKNIWKDFSTGRGGDALAFLMTSRGMSEEEALIYLAIKFKVPLDQDLLGHAPAPADHRPPPQRGHA